MLEDDRIPKMRPFVMSLLVVASGDTRTLPENVDIARNAALRYALAIAGASPVLAARAIRGDWSFGEWIESEGDARPDEFFLLCGRLIDAIDRRIRGRHSRVKPEAGDEPSAYDHAAYLALGQTLCRAAGVRRGRFPLVWQCLENLAALEARGLQESLLRNYLANVLCDYFDASQARAEFPSLPMDTEESFRTQEGAALAAHVLALAGHGGGPVDYRALQRGLQDLIGRVWIAERALDD